MKNIDIGIDMKKREAIVCILQKILATENIVNLKIRKCHWNIEGSHFSDAHKFFEELYESSAENIDEIAERIRMLGSLTRASYREFIEESDINDQDDMITDYEEMVKNLLSDKEKIILQMRQYIQKVGELGDVGTEDFLTELIQKHEKDAWMLRSIIS